MKLTEFATELVAKNHFVKAAFGGFAGSGKTRTSSEFVAGAYKELKVKKPVLLIDNEKGSRFLIPFFKERGIKVLLKDTVYLADVLQALEFLKAGEIGFLQIDTLTKVWYNYVREYKKKNKVTFMSLDHWGKILPAWQEEFSDRFVDCEGNIVFTGRGGFKYAKEEDTYDEATGRTKKGSFVQSGVKMKLAGETPFEPDLNVWMELKQEITGGKSKKLEVWREAQVIKSRFDGIDGKTFKNPTYDAFRPLVQYLLSTPIGEVAGETLTENLAPSDDGEYYHRKRERDIVLEEIQGALVTRFPSTGGKDKAAKLTLTEKVFGTTSWTKMTGMPVEDLDKGLSLLRDIFVKLDENDGELTEQKKETTGESEDKNRSQHVAFAIAEANQQTTTKGIQSIVTKYPQFIEDERFQKAIQQVEANIRATSQTAQEQL